METTRNNADRLPQPTRRIPTGFTLVELLIVVVILAILAAVAIPSFNSTKIETEQSAFASELRIFVDAAVLYHAKYEIYLEDSGSGLFPADFEEYADQRGWVNGTPIGGVWDSELDSFGIKSGLGVHFNGVGETHDDAYMTQIDTLIDDGNLATGGFRKIAAGRYYFIVAQV